MNRSRIEFLRSNGRPLTPGQKFGAGAVAILLFLFMLVAGAIALAVFVVGALLAPVVALFRGGRKPAAHEGPVPASERRPGSAETSRDRNDDQDGEIVDAEFEILD